MFGGADIVGAASAAAPPRAAGPGRATQGGRARGAPTGARGRAGPGHAPRLWRRAPGRSRAEPGGGRFPL